MSPAEYLVAVKEYILGDSRIERFAVIRERVSVADAHLRARVVFADRSQLEFSEYVQRTPNGQLEVVTYRTQLVSHTYLIDARTLVCYNPPGRLAPHLFD